MLADMSFWHSQYRESKIVAWRKKLNYTDKMSSIIALEMNMSDIFIVNLMRLTRKYISKESEIGDNYWDMFFCEYRRKVITHKISLMIPEWFSEPYNLFHKHNITFCLVISATISLDFFF